MTTVRRPLRRDVDQHQMFAGRVRHMPAVRRYARIKHRRGTLSCGDAIRRQHTGATAAVFGDLGQEQLTVDREDHTAASRIHRIRDNARAAFTGALATGLLLGRHVLVISVRKQHTRVGQQHLPMCAVRVEHAQPQRGHQVLRAVGTQEQRAGTVANRGRGTRGAAGEPQRLRLVAGKIADCIMKSRHIVHAHHGSHRTGQTTPAALPHDRPAGWRIRRTASVQIGLTPHNAVSEVEILRSNRLFPQKSQLTSPLTYRMGKDIERDHHERSRPF